MATFQDRAQHMVAQLDKEVRFVCSIFTASLTACHYADTEKTSRNGMLIYYTIAALQVPHP